VLDENEFMLDRCFIFWMMARVMVVSVNVQVESSSCGWSMRKKDSLSKYINRDFIGHAIPSVIEIPAEAFLVMVSANEPLFRVHIIKFLVPVLVSSYANITQVNKHISRFTNHHEVADDRAFKTKRTVAVFLHFLMSEVGICDNPIIHKPILTTPSNGRFAPFTSALGPKTGLFCPKK
jgi:hypothetical protein